MKHSFARKLHVQFQQSTGRFGTAAQGRQIQIGLFLDLVDRRLVDAEALGDLLLGALCEHAEGFQTFHLRDQLGRARLDLGAILGRNRRLDSLHCPPSSSILPRGDSRKVIVEPTIRFRGERRIKNASAPPRPCRQRRERSPRVGDRRRRPRARPRHCHKAQLLHARTELKRSRRNARTQFQSIPLAMRKFMPELQIT
jgi:hypothetical protein